MLTNFEPLLNVLPDIVSLIIHPEHLHFHGHWQLSQLVKLATVAKYCCNNSLFIVGNCASVLTLTPAQILKHSEIVCRQFHNITTPKVSFVHRCNRSKGRHPKKRTGFFGNFSQRGGSVFSIPKTFVNLPSDFWCVKIILRCQNMFYNSGEVISDQFNHLIPDLKSGKF